MKSSKEFFSIIKIMIFNNFKFNFIIIWKIIKLVYFFFHNVDLIIYNFYFLNFLTFSLSISQYHIFVVVRISTLQKNQFIYLHMYVCTYIRMYIYYHWCLIALKIAKQDVIIYVSCEFQSINWFVKNAIFTTRNKLNSYF